MNPSELTLEAGVQLVDAMGNHLRGTRIYTVKPYSLTQLNDVFGSEFASFRPPAGGPYRLNMFVNLDNGATHPRLRHGHGQADRRPLPDSRPGHEAVTRALLVDLGKVLVGFDHQVTCDRIAEATGTSAGRLRPRPLR